jgi:hypothetical protein
MYYYDSGSGFVWIHSSTDYIYIARNYELKVKFFIMDKVICANISKKLKEMTMKQEIRICRHYSTWTFTSILETFIMEHGRACICIINL